MRSSGIKNPVLTVLLLSVAMSLSGCRQSSSAPSREVMTRLFPQPQIPALYTTVAERQAYVAEHYWDAFLKPGFTSRDSTLFCGVSAENLESAVGMYASILANVDYELARKSCGNLVGKLEAFARSISPDIPSETDASNQAGSGHSASGQADTGHSARGKKDSGRHAGGMAGSGHRASGPADTGYSASSQTDTLAINKLISLIDRYLYDPNSPVRNEDIYQPFAEALSRSELVPSSRRGSYAFTARNCSLNSYLTPAADFLFRDIDGRTYTLYGVKAEMTLLFFSNPGCHACRDITDALMARSYIPDMISRGELAVVNVYIDEEIDKWKEYRKDYPSSWLNGYDPTFSIRQDMKYHVRAIPSLYLLDKDKRVLLKDAPQERVFDVLDSRASSRERCDKEGGDKME